MGNYYQLLKIEKTASHEEIEERIDDQYAKWRSLVTHHDSGIVAQANQALKILEEMRATLLDPENRELYDLELEEEQGSISGLADPDMLFTSRPATTYYAPPRPRVEPTATSEPHLESRVDAWICKNCGKPNPIGTQFCAKCGKTIGLDCPNCGVISELANKFCTNCGVIKADHFKQEQEATIKELQKEINMVRKEISDGEASYRNLVKLYPEKFKFDKWGCGYNVIGLILFGFIVIVSINLESWTAFYGLFFLWLAGVIAYQQLSIKSNVDNYIENDLKDRLKSLEETKREVQQLKYGE